MKGGLNFQAEKGSMHKINGGRPSKKSIAQQLPADEEQGTRALERVRDVKQYSAIKTKRKPERNVIVDSVVLLWLRRVHEKCCVALFAQIGMIASTMQTQHFVKKPVYRY